MIINTVVVFSHAFYYWRDFYFHVRFELFIEDFLFICPNQTLHILEDLSLYSQNLKYFGIPRYGTWSKCQFFSPTVELTLENTLLLLTAK